MQSNEIRDKFLKFFEKRGHTVVPSSSLVPDNDSSVLFTTAGMQQFKPYYLGKRDALKDFGSLNTVSVQKCLRTSDIEEVGDERHLTFFEMLGNFSFGGYWKKEAIQYAHDFVTREMGLKIDHITVFKGEDGVPADTESETIWKSIDPNLEVKKFGRADNFWGPTGVEGPCGPTTEIYVDGIEIWNIVFNEFYQNKDKTLKPLEVKGIDTGMGLERLAMVSQKVPTVFDTDLFDFAKNPKTHESRIVADHIRAVVMMISDGVRPSNTERGYVLRRLIRRTYLYNKNLGLMVDNMFNHENYKNLYQFDSNAKTTILEETVKYKKTLEDGVKKVLTLLQKKYDYRKKYIFDSGKTMIDYKDMIHYGELTAKDLFDFYTQEGIDPEIVLDYWEKYYKNGLPKELNIIPKFQELKIKHQEISKAGMEQKFKGGLAGHSEMEVKYHTTTHLLHQALREVLGKDVFQKGSNITPERLRFDFSFQRKMTDDQKKKVEDLVNDKIRESLPVSFEDIPMEEAKKRGALGLFEEKYGDKVRVYKIGDFSLEFCGGPHVDNTSVLGKFKIAKEEATSTGVRRIKAILE